MTFRRGKPPKMRLVDGKPAMVKPIFRCGHSFAIYLPIEWVRKNKFPEEASVQIIEGSLIIKKYEESDEGA